MFDIDYEKFIRDRISSLRTKIGVSARDMSLSIGQSENYINMIENGYLLPSITVFIYICEYFGIPPKEFFDIENNNPKMIQDISNGLKCLRDDQLAIVASLVENFNKEK